MSESGLSTLNQGLADVGDAKSSLVRGGDVIVDDGGEVESDIVFSHANLLWHFDNLNLDINLNKALGQGVDMNKTRVDGAGELAELGDETNIALRDGLVRVGADDAARNGTKETDEGAKGVDCAAVSSEGGMTGDATYS